MLNGKSILLGVTGSVAAYKAIDLVRRLKDQGASVQVIMTEASHRFVTPLSLELASGQQVYSDMFTCPLAHISLPKSADLFVTAPATANTIAKYSQGICNDLLSTSMLAFKGPSAVAPAMNWRMWEHPVVRRNTEILLSLGVRVIPPEKGMLACGEEGVGRMASTEEIIEALHCMATAQDMVGESVLVTAGPTREYIDPVRYISNRSSGRMGYAFARMAKRRGADVTLITGPSPLTPPDVNVVKVETTRQMHDAVMSHVGNASVLIMTAAVADYTPSEPSDTKGVKKEELFLPLRATVDILESVGRLGERPFLVGFSAGTGDGIEKAKEKLRAKNCDMMVFNDVSATDAGFDVDTNRVVVIVRDKMGNVRDYPLALMHKEAVAGEILDMIREVKRGD